MSLAQLLSQLGSAPGFGGGFIQGRKDRSDEQLRNIQRQKLMQEMEAAELAMDPSRIALEDKSREAKLRHLTAETDVLEKSLKEPPVQDYNTQLKEADGLMWEYDPRQRKLVPAINPMTGEQLKAEEKDNITVNVGEKGAYQNYQHYVDKARAHSKTFQAANRLLPALTESIEKGQKATGLAAKTIGMVDSVLSTLGADPKARVNLLNMDPSNMAVINSALSEMMVGELKALGANPTDTDLLKAADIVGPETTTQEALLALTKVRLEPMVEWQKEFKKAREKYGDDYAKISNYMLDYEIENPLAAYETEIGKAENVVPPEGITIEQAWEKSKNIASKLGKGARELFGEMFQTIPKAGYVKMKDRDTGQIYEFQDGVLIGVK